MIDAWIIVWSIVAAIVTMKVVFFIGWKKDRYDVIDIAWGVSFIAIALTSFTLQPGEPTFFSVQYLVTLLVTVWGVRLARHILRRLLKSDKEDPRYTDMRKNWKGSVALNMFYRVYLLQGLLAVLVASPVIIINASDTTDIGLLAVIGLSIWLIGFVFESVGDAQLRNFLANPKHKGKLMTEGLWSYTRHPNYFGEMAQWWGIFVIALSAPYGWYGILGPALITYLLLFISGVPLTEKRFEGRPGWKQYKRRTSKIFPLPPKKV